MFFLGEFQMNVGNIYGLHGFLKAFRWFHTRKSYFSQTRHIVHCNEWTTKFISHMWWAFCVTNPYFLVVNQLKGEKYESCHIHTSIFQHQTMTPPFLDINIHKWYEFVETKLVLVAWILFPHFQMKYKHIN